MKGHIVLVDDDKLLLGFMDEHLSMNDYKTTPFESPVDALAFLEKNKADLIITDVKMNEMNGDELQTIVKKKYPDIGLIMITGFGNINHAVNALRKGAFDYVTKPFKAAEIIQRVERFFKADSATLHSILDVANSSSKKSDKDPHQSDEKIIRSISDNDEDGEDNLKFVGEDPNVLKLMNILPMIAKNDAPVMIQGESGTGKEVFAYQIHANSDRADKPYIKINCANLPSELVESTLFGHLKGSFTGAITDQKGAFDAANGGTLLLDEITEIDINVQAKLLRVLQEKEFYRLGSQKPIKPDVRIIATSNRNIGKAISDGDFRDDLYYRLNVFPITIPPLRKRPGDIPVLAHYFVKRYTDRYNMEPKDISSDLMEFFIENEWKGNVRELDNMIHRGVILSHKSPSIKLEHIQNNLFADENEETTETSFSDLPLMSIEDMELQMIRRTLEHTGGNQKKAAEILGISDRTIRNKLKSYEE